MKVKALTSFSLGGGRDVHPGDVFDLLPEANARTKVSMGWVEPVGSVRPRARTPRGGADGDAVTTQTVPQTHRDPAPARRRGGKKGNG